MKLLALYFLCTVILSTSMTIMGYGFLKYVKYQKNQHLNRLMWTNEARKSCGTYVVWQKIYDGYSEYQCGDVLKEDE